MHPVHHFGIIVKDLDRSIEFYHRKLGLEFANEPTPVDSGERLEQGVGVKGARLRQVSLTAGNVIIELLEYSQPDWPLNGPLPQYVTGSSHVAFQVEDIHAAKKELEAKGIEFFSDVNVNDGVLDGWSWVYFSDPDGHVFELVQQSYYNEEERKAGIEAYKRSRGWL